MFKLFQQSCVRESEIKQEKGWLLPCYFMLIVFNFTALLKHSESFQELKAVYVLYMFREREFLCFFIRLCLGIHFFLNSEKNDKR